MTPSGSTPGNVLDEAYVSQSFPALCWLLAVSDNMQSSQRSMEALICVSSLRPLCLPHSWYQSYIQPLLLP